MVPVRFGHLAGGMIGFHRGLRIPTSSPTCFLWLAFRVPRIVRRCCRWGVRCSSYCARCRATPASRRCGWLCLWEVRECPHLRHTIAGRSCPSGVVFLSGAAPESWSISAKVRIRRCGERVCSHFFHRFEDCLNSGKLVVVLPVILGIVFSMKFHLGPFGLLSLGQLSIHRSVINLAPSLWEEVLTAERHSRLGAGPRRLRPRSPPPSALQRAAQCAAKRVCRAATPPPPPRGNRHRACLYRTTCTVY